MDETESATETPHDGWGFNKRGYIQGGHDTPIFLQVKRRFNTGKTKQKDEERARIVEQAIPMLIAAQQKLNTQTSQGQIENALGFRHQPTKEQNA